MNVTQTTENSLFTFGIQSDTIDNEHIVMLDFDTGTYNLKYIIKELKYLQDVYKLSDFYVYKTEHGFHAFTLDKLELELIAEMLYNTNLVDELFTYFAVERGFFVLRWGKDKEYLFTLTSDNDYYEKSLAHYDFFKEIIKTPLINRGVYDSYTKFKYIVYRSEKHGWYDYEG